MVHTNPLYKIPNYFRIILFKQDDLICCSFSRRKITSGLILLYRKQKRGGCVHAKTATVPSDL